MRLVATMMVRDEVDVVALVLEHLLAEGIDRILVTDNGSVDGTRDLLDRYAAAAPVTVFDDPVQRKQQGEAVTRMARLAATEYGADWVLNVDADEFFIPVDRTLTLRTAFESIPRSLGAFAAPVTNLVGAPARHPGSGIGRLRWRDGRSDERLEHEAGIHAQPTASAIHVGDPDVTVSQGNHFVSIPSAGAPEPASAIEVLHLPWRSYAQFRLKVDNAGRAYTSNPDVDPSPRHHGMRDYRFLLAGCLEDMYVLRHPDSSLLGSDPVFLEDGSLADRLSSRLDSGRAAVPEELARAMSDATPDYTTGDIERARLIGPIALALDRIRTEQVSNYRIQIGQWRDEVAKRDQRIERLRDSRAFRIGTTVTRLGRWFSRGRRAAAGASDQDC